MRSSSVRFVRDQRRRYRVLAALRLYETASQCKLAGVFSYLDTRMDWDFELLRTQEELTPDALDKAVEEGLDGLIVSIRHDHRLFWKIADLRCPVVVLDNDGPELSKRKKDLVIIRNDPESLVSTALQAFSRSGRFEQLAFVESREPADWSALRAQAFRRNAGRSAVMFPPTGRNDDRAALADFLKRLALPAAVLAASDARAGDVIAAAKEVGLEIPRQLSVLGIDNDPYICTRIRPAIASVEPDFFAEGKAAAKLLDKMMRQRTPVSARTVLFGVKRTILRDSLANLPPAHNVLSRAREYIRENATHGIRPNDVAAYLRISRQLLDLRFREAKKGGVGELIAQTRLNEVKRLLVETATPISQIGDLAGFSNANALKNAFKRETGMSMRDWRTAPRGRRKRSPK